MIKIARRSFLADAGGSLIGATLESRSRRRTTGEQESRTGNLMAGDPRDFPVRDRRLEVRTLATVRMPAKFNSLPRWQARASVLREQILSAAGLWPMPDKTPLRMHVFDRIDCEGYSVEKVYFESHPHFFCTGNLYRPRGNSHTPPFPGVLCPHGHWAYGRLEHNPGDDNGCSIPTLCLNLALHGFVSFAYDMVGINDSFQVPHDWGMDASGPWGLTPEATRLSLWGINLLGLQLWNSIRSLDFLCSLEDVDAKRLGITGPSGGATQAFLLTAVDDRLRLSASVNMISHFMQGGDICENAPNLRIDTDNMEIGAMFAPRPLLMISATGDWTRDTRRIEFPAIQSIYRLFNAGAQVTNEEFASLHNYNRYSRGAVYRFFTNWLAMETGKPAPPLIEEKTELSLDPGKLLVFARRQPPSDAFTAQQLTDCLLSEARTALAKMPQNIEELGEYRKKFGPVYRAALMAEVPSADDLRWWPTPGPEAQTTRSVGKCEKLILQRISIGDRIPGQLLLPSRKFSQTAALLIHPEGSAASLGSPGSVSPLAHELIKRGCLLFAVDVFQTGEALDATRKMEGRFFPTYNRTDAMQRVQDILTAVSYLNANWHPRRTVITGEGMAGLWCLLARPFLDASCAMAADTARFESGIDDAYLKTLNIPLLRRAGDFQSAALLASGSPLLLYNHAESFSVEPFRKAFSLQGVSNHLRTSALEVSASDIGEWVTSA